VSPGSGWLSSDSFVNIRGVSVLSFALERWTDIWRSRHHILLRLARNTTVLHIPPPFYIRDVIGRVTPGPTGLENIAGNLFTYVHPRWLPVNYRFPLLETTAARWRTRQIRATMETLGMTQPILYLWHPAFADMMGVFDESLVVYHCYDEYRAFQMGHSERVRTIEQEERILRRADLVFVASEVLWERRRMLNKHTYVVRNGVDYELFARARGAETPVPDDLAQIHPPVIACVATQIEPVMNVALLTQIFRRCPQWSLALVGAERLPNDKAGAAMRELQALPNVHFFGRQPLEKIPGYLKACDVCVIPWAVNDLTITSSSPLKLYEYLAAGKPVISTPFPLLRQLNGIIDFAETVDEWIEAIRRAIMEGANGIERRQAEARANTWDTRVAFITEKIVDRLGR
jgi:glycosyltransferase involved in cell wall biosynthesis